MDSCHRSCWELLVNALVGEPNFWKAISSSWNPPFFRGEVLKLQGCKPHGWRRDLLTNNSGWWNVKYFLFVHHYPGEDEAILTVLIFFNWIGLVQPPTSNPLILTFEISTGPSKGSVPLPHLDTKSPGGQDALHRRAALEVLASLVRMPGFFKQDQFDSKRSYIEEVMDSTHLRSRRFADREEGEAEAGLPRPSQKEVVQTGEAEDDEMMEMEPPQVTLNTIPTAPGPFNSGGVRLQGFCSGVAFHKASTLLRWCVSPRLALSRPVPVPKPPPSVPPECCTSSVPACVADTTAGCCQSDGRKEAILKIADSKPGKLFSF